MSLLLYQAELRALAAQSKRIVDSALAILRLRKKGGLTIRTVMIADHPVLHLLGHHMN